MPRPLVFCVSEDAKAFTRIVLNAKIDDSPVNLFCLVESRAGPPKGEGFKNVLDENEAFETDFIGATLEDCQTWAATQSTHNRSFNSSMMIIVDARSAKDETVLFRFYYSLPGDMEPPPFPGYGQLPRQKDVWYDFRVDYRMSPRVMASLEHVSPGVVYPIYFGEKETFTDENGVFNVLEAERFCRDQDPDVLESDIHRRRLEPME